MRYSHCANPVATLLARLLLCAERLLLMDERELLTGTELMLLETLELLCDERLLVTATELLRGALLITLEDLLDET